MHVLLGVLECRFSGSLRDAGFCDCGCLFSIRVIER